MKLPIKAYLSSVQIDLEKGVFRAISYDVHFKVQQWLNDNIKGNYFVEDLNQNIEDISNPVHKNPTQLLFLIKKNEALLFKLKWC